MMNSIKLVIYTIGMVAALTAVNPALCQMNSDPFAKHISAVKLNSESIIVGIAYVSQTTGIALSLEYPLGESFNTPPTLQKFTTVIESGSVSEVLNELVALDRTFTWQRSGNMVNVFPRSTGGDPQYVMNRTLQSLSYTGISDIEQAVFAAVNQLPPPKEQIAMMQTGTILALPKPWTTIMHDVPIREVLNRIAAQLGSQAGWELSGGKDFRLLRFHIAYSVNRPSAQNVGK